MDVRDAPDDVEVSPPDVQGRIRRSGMDRAAECLLVSGDFSFPGSLDGRRHFFLRGLLSASMVEPSERLQRPGVRAHALLLRALPGARPVGVFRRLSPGAETGKLAASILASMAALLLSPADVCDRDPLKLRGA